METNSVTTDYFVNSALIITQAKVNILASLVAENTPKLISQGFNDKLITMMCNCIVN